MSETGTPEEQTGKPGFDRKMTPEEINQLPLTKYSGPIRLVRTEKELHKALPEIREEPVLGFDTETRPAFKKGESFTPSVLQLATEKSVFLVQLKKVHLGDGLKDILSDPKIKKTGVALDFDVAKLKELSTFEDAGFIDLGKVARERQIMNHGLRGLAAVFLGIRISKQAQRSNWERPKLLDSQVSYAATDAWISRELALCFQSRGYLELLPDQQNRGR